MVLTCKDYHVGWVCALPVEYLLAEVMLDKEHDSVPYPEDEENEYLLDQIDSKKTGGHHNVVITLLPSAEKGKASAATVAKDMVRTFPNLKIRLLVGTAGGIPGSPVQLGDIVVERLRTTPPASYSTTMESISKKERSCVKEA